MIIVAVREVETKKLLGFFWARTHEALWWNVDAIDEPSAYEWTRLNRDESSLYFRDDEHRDMSDIISDGGDDEEDDPSEEEPTLNGLCLGYGVLDALNDGPWKRFDYADEGYGGIATIMKDMERRKRTTPANDD